MASYSDTIEIAAPPEDVWAVLADVERWPTWTASMREVGKVADGPLAPGAKVRVRQPRLPKLTWTVRDVEPGRSFSWTARSGGIVTVADHRITPAAGGRQVELSIDQHGPGARLSALLYARLTRRYLRLETEGLKRRVEGG